MDLLENCETCYPFTLSEFPSTIVIQGNITPDSYYFKFTDKFGNSYITKLIVVGLDGVVTIKVNPVLVADRSFIDPQPSRGWFNRNAGRFYIECSVTKEIWTPVNFTFSAVTYGCIVVEFANDDSNKNTIL